MAEMSDYLEKAFLDHLTGNASLTPPTDIYLALFTAAPNDAGGGTEVSGDGYARQVVEFDAAHATNGTAASSTAASFTANGGNWGEITHVALFDAVTGGNMLFHSAITTPRTINDGDTLNFAIGSVVMTLE